MQGSSIPTSVHAHQKILGHTRPDMITCLQSTPPPNSRPFIGGAGLEVKTAQPIFISNCVFEGNSGRQGSGLHLDACPSALVWNTSFDHNHAQYEGGAVALVNSDGQGLLLGKSNLTGNSGESLPFEHGRWCNQS